MICPISTVQAAEKHLIFSKNGIFGPKWPFLGFDFQYRVHMKIKHPVL
jgi:hypothetical protein